MATLFSDDFVTDLTADVNKRLAELARQPIRSTEKLEREIAKDDRQLKRLTDRLDKVDLTHIDALVSKAEDMGRKLEAKRQRLKELQRAARRPSVKSVRQQDVVAELTKLRELLQGDVGVAAQLLKDLIGDVVVERRPVAGSDKTEMIAHFAIHAIPALVSLNRGKGANGDDPTDTMWEFLDADRWTMTTDGPATLRGVEVSLNVIPKYELLLPQIIAMATAGSSISLISRALGVSAEVVRDALHLHHTGERSPKRIDGRRRKRTHANEPYVPKYKQLEVEVDRRRKAGDGFDRLARELKVSRGTVVRAYDFANRDEAIAAAHSGRPPNRPNYRQGEASKAAEGRGKPF